MDETLTDREVKPALLKGWKRRCPNCGSGALFDGYLKVHEACSECNQELHHQRADDGPAYLTIVVVGHLMAPALLWVYAAFQPKPLVLALGFTVVTVALSLYLLPRFKGMMIAFQWAKRMHGFGAS